MFLHINHLCRKLSVGLRLPADGATLQGEGRPVSLLGRYSASEADILGKIRAEMARFVYSASRHE